MCASTSDKPCVEPDCNEPRMRGPRSGKLLSRCVKHQRAYDRKAKEAKRRTQGVKQPPKRNPRKAKPVQRKLLLLDYERDLVQRLTVTEIEQVPMAGLRRGQLHPHTVGIYIHMGYQVAEIRTTDQQAELMRLQSRIDCARFYLQHDADPLVLRQILAGELSLKDLKSATLVAVGK